MPRDPRFWTISILVFLFFAVLGLYVVPNWNTWFQAPKQRVAYLYESVWCPVCEGETVGTSQTEVSKELRGTIREMVHAGRTNREIFRHVEENYGPDMVAVPRRGWMSRLSYGVPYLALGAVAVGLFALAWRWRRDADPLDDDGSPGMSEETERKIDELAHREGPLG